MENKVYFSNRETNEVDDWGFDDAGQLKVLIVPIKWWSIKDWKFALMFAKDFSVNFVCGEPKT